MRILRSILVILALAFPACDDALDNATAQALDSSLLDLKAAEPAIDVSLLVPPYIYATVGFKTEIFFDNIVLVDDSAQYRFRVSGIDLGKKKDLGKNDRKWSFVPKADDVGHHLLTIAVESDRGGPTLAETETTLVVSAPNSSGARLLLVGDSLTAAGVYPAALARLMPSSTFVSHGVGGWRYAYALSSPTSPFLDVDAYVRDAFAGVPPDVVTFELGINDVFNGSRDLGGMDDPAAVERAIDIMLESADALLARFRASMPAATFGIALVTPPNARESAFEANYGARVPPVHRASWRRAQHRTVQRQIAHFGGREREGIFLIPTEVSLDPWAGFPIDNALHPNALGYEQIATTFHAWAVNLPLGVSNRHGTW